MRPSLPHLVRIAAAAAGLAATAPAAARDPSPAAPVLLVVCAPGYPGTTAEAQPAMDALADAAAGAAGWPAGSVAAVYLPGEREGSERLRQGGAAAALVPLPFLLAHAAALRLEPRLQVEMQGAGSEERWALAVRKGAAPDAAALAGFTVQSIAGYAPEFVRGAVAGWGRLPPTAKVVESAQVLSGLRQAASGAPVAVLLDGAQAAALPSLPFAADLEIVARSAPLPTAFVARVGGRLPDARWKALEAALLRLGEDPPGAEALRGIRVVRFVRAGPKALASARRAAGMGP